MENKLLSAKEITSLTGRYYKTLEEDGSTQEVIYIDKIDIDCVYVDAWGFAVDNESVEEDRHIDFGVWVCDDDDDDDMPEDQRLYRLDDYYIEISKEEAKAFTDKIVEKIYHKMNLK